MSCQLAFKLPDKNEQNHMRKQARKGAVKFVCEALKLASEKDSLKNEFPRKLEFPKNAPSFVKEWCVFCLGSKLCSQIYKEKYMEPSKEIEGHLPVLSIIIHFDQSTVFTVLKHLHEWFLSLGMEESLGRWIFAILACIKKPLDPNFKELIKTFYKDCEKRLKDCDESEMTQLYLISGILEFAFCVVPDKVEPPSKTFSNLQI